jgi:plastocyanin
MKTLTRLIGVGLLSALALSTAQAQSRPIQTGRADAYVMMSEFGFEPNTVYVAPGGYIQWENHDPFSFHSVKSDTPPFGPESDLVFRNGMPYGSYFWWRVPIWAHSGSVITYHCKFHGAAGSGSGFNFGYGFGETGRIIVL